MGWQRRPIHRALFVLLISPGPPTTGASPIALDRFHFSVRTMCRLQRVHPSGFYTWLKNPLSSRANADKRQTDLLLKAWGESGKVYGYHKLHDDLLEPGCASDASCRDQGADRLQALFRHLWRQACRRYPEPARPAI